MRIFVHLMGGVMLVAVGVMSMAYPYLAGTYDRLAVGLSLLAQVFGLVGGVLLIPIGLAWGIAQVRWNVRRKRNLPIKANASLFVWGAVVAFSLGVGVLSLLAVVVIGRSFGVGMGVLWGGVLWYIVRWLHTSPHTALERLKPMPLYLIAVPSALILAQLLLAQPLTQASRARAIAHSADLIRDIEAYNLMNKSYPPSLLATYSDYETGVIGISHYQYVPQGDGYNLFFEQPRFLLDDLGVREFVVYNPLDEHTIISHASWILLLRPSDLNRQQGWFAFADAPILHWKYFWFD